MSIIRRPFIQPRELVEPLDVVLVAPFRAFGNKPGLVEMVFAAVPLAAVADVTNHNDLFEIADARARPFSLKICGEGWIRLEQQLGRDVLTWENRGATLYHATLRRGRSVAFDYIGIVTLTTNARAEKFGQFA